MTYVATTSDFRPETGLGCFTQAGERPTAEPRESAMPAADASDMHDTTGSTRVRPKAMLAAAIGKAEVVQSA